MTRIVRIMLMQLLTRAVGFTWVQQLTWAVRITLVAAVDKDSGQV